jgi:hypothetical protein
MMKPIDVACLNLGVDPENMRDLNGLRGAVVLPHGLDGKL